MCAVVFSTEFVLDVKHAFAAAGASRMAVLAYALSAREQGRPALCVSSRVHGVRQASGQ